MGHLWSSSVNYTLTSLGITLPLKDRQNIFKFIPFHGFYHLSCLHTLWCIPPDLNSLHFSASVPQFCHVFFQTSVFSFFSPHFFLYCLFLLLGCKNWYLSLGVPYLSLNMCELTNDVSLPYQSGSSVLICSEQISLGQCFLAAKEKSPLLWGKCLIFALTKQCKLFLILFTLPLQYYVCKKRKKKIRPPKGRMNQLSELSIPLVLSKFARFFSCCSICALKKKKRCF